MAAPRKAAGGVSDAAVKKATGKSWKQWFGILDRAGSARKPHKEIAAWLAGKHPDMGGWWCQMVTVAYEQEKGLRKKHEKPQGFQISRSKTVAAPLSRLYAAWKDGRQRAKWLPKQAVTVRRATANKSLRITWSDKQTSLDVYFYSKGRGKSQVVVNHGKLAGAAAAEGMKKFWSAALGRLKESLEA